MKPIKKVLINEQVVQSILEYIRVHNLREGDKLPTEAEFTELFKVSRTSIREALKALSINGIISSIPGKGTFIEQNASSSLFGQNGLVMFTAEVTITEIMEVRRALETEAILLAIKRASDEEVCALGDIISGLRQALESNSEEWIRYGFEFHKAIAEMSGNRLLIDIIMSLSDISNKYRKAVFENTCKRRQAHIDNHVNIYLAIKNRDPENAQRLIREHMDNMEQVLKHVLNETIAIQLSEM